MLYIIGIFHFYYQSETTLGPGGPAFPGMPYKKGKKRILNLKNYNLQHQYRCFEVLSLHVRYITIFILSPTFTTAICCE